MNSDSTHQPNAATPETQSQHEGQVVAPTSGCGPARPPDDYKRRHLGREAADRWLLHQTLLADLMVNTEAESAPQPQPLASPSNSPPAGPLP